MATRSLVVDASVWIDLANGGILDLVFRLGYTVASPDLVVAEIKPPLERLNELGLVVLELTGNQVLAVEKLAVENRHTSAIDLAAFIVARDSGGVLLTGDQRLRRFAEARGLQARGVLWVLDEAIRLGLLHETRAAGVLETIIDAGSRLPRSECEERLRRWRHA